MGKRRIALITLTAASLTVGTWALFAPHSFATSFPFGRGWVALHGAYNEHLIRDFGAMNLALATVTGCAAWQLRADIIRLAALATLVFAVPHLAFHATHLEHYTAADAIANLVTLATQVLVPLWLLCWPTSPTGRRSQAAREADRTPAVAPAQSHERA